MAIDVSVEPTTEGVGTTRRMTFLAIATGTLAAILLIVAAAGGPDTDAGGGGGMDWAWGLLLIAGPLLCAAATRSVASSMLLRPVGSIATLLCGAAAAVHVGVAVDERGAGGWAFGLPAVATVLLLLAAVARGPDRRRGVSATAVEPDVAIAPPVAAATQIGGPPLDVLGPLRDARNHAVRSALAWLVVLGILAVVSVPLFRLLGWPRVETPLNARVVSVHDIGEEIAITFEAPYGDRTVEWTDVREETSWEPGERTVAFLASDGTVHHDQQFGLVGLPLFMPALLVGMFALFAIRRVWGLAVAWWDVHHGQEPPRLGYAAVIDDPAPKTWRPLLAVWHEDPTGHGRLAKPDAVYRADDETGESLQTPANAVVVRQAWIDTGIWARSKPRWVGSEDGVVVPHRRSFLGRWYVRAVTRRASVAGVVPLHHSPPDSRVQSLEPEHLRPRHRIAGMIAWRLLALVLGMAASFLYVNDGQPAQIEDDLSQAGWFDAGHDNS